MKKILFILLPVMLCAFMTSCGYRTEEPQQTVNETAAPRGALLDKMTLEEKVGQLLFARCPAEEETDALMALRPGGILMFGRDFEGLSKEEVKDKIKDLRAKSEIPLIIGVDEEGGTVVRVSSNTNLAPEKFRAPQDIYRDGGIEALTEDAAEKSKLLRSLGITMNLAPVADVTQNEEDFMYSRSMGLDAEETAECIKNIVLAMKSNSMLSCLKHFPGYGSTADTHTGGASDERGARSFAQMTENEDGTKTGGDFIPFQAGIAAGADCVLVSHNTVNAFDSENPASLSPAIHKILRSELGFDGVVMTDDMAMGAVTDVENAYVKAVNAGNDLIITTDYETGYNQILDAVKSGGISEETLDRAVGRVLKMKGLM